MKGNCIFCKIIAGEIPSAVVYEDEDFKAIMDISPAAKGHVVLIAKEHCRDLFELGDEAAAKALITARKVAKAIQEQLHCDGINLLQNNGEAAGQTVFHFHMHLIPRYMDDPVNITWTPSEYGNGEAAELAAKIRGKLT